MENETNNATPMSDCMEQPRPAWSKCIRSNTDVVIDLAFERREVSHKLSNLEKAIESDPAAVSDYHKELWHKQAEAMRAYKEVLGERIKDLIDG